MPFKDLEQKHNLVNSVILACGKHPADADIHPLLEERLERFYEDATVEGMSTQMMRSVDRAVNAMVKPWQGLTEDDVAEVERWVEFKEAGSGQIVIGKLVRYIELKLRSKNNAV